MKKSVLVLFLVLLAAGGLGYWQLWRSSGNSRDHLRLMGHIEATETDLSFKIPGIITKINFQEGDYLKAGAVVAELDGQDLRNELAAAAARLKAGGSSFRAAAGGFPTPGNPGGQGCGAPGRGRPGE